MSRCAENDEVLECSVYFLSWATDSVAKYLENDTYGLLENEQRRKSWHKTVDKVIKLTPVVKQFPFFMPFVLRVPEWIMRTVSQDLNLVLLMHKVRSTSLPSFGNDLNYIALKWVSIYEASKLTHLLLLGM